LRGVNEMAQITTGIRSLLNSPSLYDFVQDILGARRGRLEFVNGHVRPSPGDRILDLGCGTARILDYLPKGAYQGFDESQIYIDAAQRHYGNRGTFTCALVGQTIIDQLQPFDLVLAMGLIHHLDEEQAHSLMKLAKSALRKGGRLVTIDPCFTTGQGAVARFLVGRDRGQNIRTAEQYRLIAEDSFKNVELTVKHRNWLPYTHCIMECTA
jgi:SAM-dependent methyltransferase